MLTDKPTIFDNVETQALSAFAKKAYLNYSMYVILDRALPHIGDGLKPVQRRIIYSMSALGLKNSEKFKKSARTIGDVLGKFHPHGDSACYEAMVLMAQPFSYRYPLIDGQGNWGSPDDPKSFAAMRYTEARLTKYAETLLAELAQGTVDWQQNFDGTLKEPKLLPACLPNILLNGATGIAVGMATDIPSHNLTEVGNACIYLLDHPKASHAELCNIIPGPDFPTGGEIITAKKDIVAIYSSGTGSIRVRGIYFREENNIVITALPYQVSGTKILEQIAKQLRSKKLPQVEDLRDESDHNNPTRLVIIPRSNRIDVTQLMEHLFATTDLERSYRINFNMIGTDGRPQVKSLHKLLMEWLAFRKTTVTRRLNYRLQKVIDRLHILDGLLIAFLNIDKIIEIIRKQDQPRPLLMTTFRLTKIQAEAILELKLRQLAKLEEAKIRQEQTQLSAEHKWLQSILQSQVKLKALIKKEINQAIKDYGDSRCSSLVERQQAVAMNVTAVLPTEAVTVILSTKGWIRAAKGHDIDPHSLNYKAGDNFQSKAKGRSNQTAVFLDSSGRVYCVAIYQMPSARGLGEPLTGRIKPPSPVDFKAVMIAKPDDYYLLACDNGYGFIVPFKELLVKSKSGKAVLKVPINAQVLMPKRINYDAHDYVACVTSSGRLLVFNLDQLPILAKGRGNKMINISLNKIKTHQEWVVDTAVFGKKDSLLVQSGKRFITIKPKDIDNYYGKRARAGNKLPRGFQRPEKLVIVALHQIA